MSLPSFTIEPVQEGDEENVMKLLKKTFFIHEPLNAAVGLINSENDTCTELEEYCTHSLKEGLSFKAVDSDNNIVGAMISGVLPLKEDTANGTDLLSQAQRCKNLKFQKILYILARREAGARLWEKYPETDLVEVKVAATDPGWRRRGIMNELLNRTELPHVRLTSFREMQELYQMCPSRQVTEQRGFRLIRLDTSSAYSAKAAETFGYTCVYKARYTDIKMDGRPILVPEPPHVDDRVYVKKLFD